MKRQSLLLSFIPILFTTLLSLNSINVDAQIKLREDSEKAKKEIEYLDNQKRLESTNIATNNMQTQDQDYKIQRFGALLTITFTEKSNTTVDNFFQKFSNILGFQNADQFVFTSSQKDNLGFTHHYYHQHYKGIPVSGGQFILNEKNGKFITAEGKFHKGLSINAVPAMTREVAISEGIKFTGAKKYLWENVDAQKALKREKNNPNASYYPKPELVIASDGESQEKGNFRLCYKVNISAELPYKKVDVFVDAHTGKVIKTISKIANTDAAAVGDTYFYKRQRFTMDSYKTSYRLQESSKRPIKTLNLLNTTDNTKAIDFTYDINIFSQPWSSPASIISKVSIKNVNTKWKDIEDGKSGEPDIYIEILNDNDDIVFSNKATYSENFDPKPAKPLDVTIPDITLLEVGNHKVKIYDHDFLTPDDLVGEFSFSSVFGVSTFKDGSTHCDITGKQTNSGAIDAHWGMEKVYDYYLNVRKRASYDGKNSTIISYLHANKSKMPGGDPNNALWNGSAMYFGDGDGITQGPMTALDVCGHEFTHAVIDHNVNQGLEYFGESGALNESFADIFGTVIEFYALGNAASWLYSDKIYRTQGSFARSLANPKDIGDPQIYPMGQPDTYNGKNWYSTAPGSYDYGGVHFNSGVQNKWFYLLSEGGKGTTEVKSDGSGGESYDVTGITKEAAATIAYKNMMEKLAKTATYPEAFFRSLEAATETGHTQISTEYRSAREAWFAVGVAKKPKIISFTPIKGKEGTIVSIKGEGFTGSSFVSFNGTQVDAPNFDIISDDEITVKVPKGATTGHIKVTAGYQIAESTDDFIIECTAPLIVDVSTTDATSFVVHVSTGTAPYTYSLDNTSFQSSNVFSGLTLGQTYTVYVKDAGECKGQQTFFLSNKILCNVQSGSGGQGTTFVTETLGSQGGSVTVDYQMYTIPDQMEIYYNNVLVATTGGLVSGGGTLTFQYNPVPNVYDCIVKLHAPNSGTAWDFIAHCPVPSTNRIVTNNINKTEVKIPDGKFQAVIFPNPVSNIANLQLSGVRTNVLVSLSDLTGKELWRSSRLTNGNVPIPIGHLSAGTYIVNVISGEQRKILKILKTK